MEVGITQHLDGNKLLVVGYTRLEAVVADAQFRGRCHLFCLTDYFPFRHFDKFHECLSIFRTVVVDDCIQLAVCWCVGGFAAHA